MSQIAVTRDQKNKKGMHPFVKYLLRNLLIYFISLGIVIGTVLWAVRQVQLLLFEPVDVKDKTSVTVDIPMGTSVRGIAEILHEKGLIRNTGVFRFYVELTDKASKLKAGRYMLSRSMTPQQILDELITGEAAVDTVKVTIPEGFSIRDIANYLQNFEKDGQKVFQFTAEQFIDAAKQFDKFAEDYTFLYEIPEARRSGEYPLEGYLFPDTYIVYVDSTPDDIIRKMLSTFERKVYFAEFRNVPLLTRIEELGMTLDQVITLASVVQEEAAVKDEFYKISAVFHNRLNIDMPLQSCATVQYALGSSERKPFLTNEEISVDSPYNTYKHKGLPVGPIASPGQLAVEAVLYPEEEFMNPEKPVLFFVYAGDNRHEFSYTAEEHAKAKQKYERRWKESQNQNQE
ncbi:endolytic transglycosylase MltG [Caldicoprobacter algeriensis]|uniref:endolytic transglycosylase MltG n=1 Tax=Caldicoprobacter algeriensis TaxID=699281 RepID=UPI00207A0907|nr:endolytic transglycosylase MltG [Caldicoprobacter algeriensis]MCM8900926.1 endolytic transglycosylase MltG [Caldicoprobacter algeriensis]